MCKDDCACKTKPARKTLGPSSQMYTNQKGTTYGISYLAKVVAGALRPLMPDFRMYEDKDGKLLIDTGLVKSSTCTAITKIS